MLHQDSLLWAQKARLDWSVYGDRNSSYFHSRANSRKKANKIEALLNDQGDWCYDVDSLKHSTTEYFCSLFQEEIPIRPNFICEVNYPSIPSEFLIRCGREVSSDEIKTALFSMGPMKSPGPDGFNALFYQNQWSTVCSSIIKYVSNIFAHPQSVKEINGTLIVLIPKKNPPESVRDLRSISLCNVIYKVISKIIANRLKPFLSQVISPNQCSFMPGKHSSDNILVAQEVIHSMRIMKGKKRFYSNQDRP